MTLIWLVRHGEAAAGFSEDTDPPLSPLGREQALQSADTLSRCVPEHATLLSSPKRRAIETGEPYAASVRGELEIDARFIELPSPGDLVARRQWLDEVLQGQWSALPEPVQLWRREIVSAIDSFTSPTVIFTHFLVINAVAAHISGQDGVVQCLPANASVHELSVEGSGWQWRVRGAMLKSVVN